MEILLIILTLICSALAARYLEKKMPVASIAHAVLFIVSSIFYIFGSDYPIFVRVSSNLLGDFYYPVIHEAIKDGIVFVNFSLSGVFVVETLIYGVVLITSTIVLIKGLKKLIKKIDVISSLRLINEQPIPEDLYPEKVQIKHSNNTYLVLGQLRN